MLKDYVNGKLLYCTMPPGSDPPGVAPCNPDGSWGSPAAAAASAAAAAPEPSSPDTAGAAAADGDAAGPSDSAAAGGGDVGASGRAALGGLGLDEADLELLEGLSLGSGPAKAAPKRPDYKFHKKVQRSKGTRGQVKDGGGYDGAALTTGKKGGIVRIGGYM